MNAPRVIAYGDAAILVVLGERVDEELNDRVHGLDRLVRQRCASQDGWGPPVPSYASLLVPYDPSRIDPADALARLEGLATHAAATAASSTTSSAETAGRLVEVPVRYGGDDGPDLDAVARATGHTPAEVAALHAGSTYRVFLLGFSPGFPYLGRLPERLHLPRRSELRARVPAGSVAIAGEQTAIYPSESPGGWHLIGRTDLRLWDPVRDPPALLAPGQRVRFVPTGHARD